MGGVTITELIDKMGLRNMTPELETDNVMLVHADVNRPALQLSGYFEHFEQSRVQIIGTVEYTYLQQLDEKKKEAIYREFMAYDIPCVIFCRDLKPDVSSQSRFIRVAFTRLRRRAICRYSEPSEAHPSSWRS
mgnify:CR=1 FL=1